MLHRSTRYLLVGLFVAGMGKAMVHATALADVPAPESFTLAPPDNDHCEDVVPEALAIGQALTFTGDNTEATFDGDAVPGTILADYPSPNTWHAFTTTECASVTVSYCGTDAGWSNVWRLLTTDCPAETIINATSSDDTTCPNGNWTFTFNDLPAGTYYLPVPNVGFGQGGGVYSIEISAEACANMGTDHCEDAEPQALVAGGTLLFGGDNSTATFDGDAVPGTILADYPSPNTWHAFTITECLNVTVSYCGTDAGWTNVWKLLTTDCPAETIINATSSDDTTCPNGNWTFTFNDLPAGTYYLPVPNVGFGQGGGVYSIEVGAQACANLGVDLCDDAEPQTLTIGGTLLFTGDNTNATFDGDAVPGTILADYPSPNTWHAFTTTDCANVTVSYCGTDAGWTNVWRLLTTDCPAETIINATSSDDTTCPNGNWTFTFNDLPAGTYYLPVPNVGFGQGGGPYSIEVGATACGSGLANDHCEDVTPVELAIGSSLTFTGDNTNATFDGDAVPGTILADYPSPNTWHAFTTTDCANVTVSYCGTDAGWTNVWRLLTTDCPAETIINATSSDDTTCPNGNWTFTFNDLPAGTYYLPVPNVGFGQGGGVYSIEVGATACGSGLANDHCEDVTPVELAIGSSLTFTGDNTNATFDGDAVPGTILADYPSPNTWHAFTTTDCANVTVSYCGTDAGWTNVWRLLTTDCPAVTIINATSSDDTTCPNGNWTFTFNDLPAGTYYLPVPNVGFGQGGGVYSIEVGATACGSGLANDHCEDVTPVELAIGSSLTFTGDNTNATFDGDAVPGTILADYPFPNTWHAFTLSGCTDLTVSYCTTAPGWSNVWRLLTTDCPAETIIGTATADTTTCSNGNWTFSFSALSSGTYYLPVPNVGFGQGGGPYSIEVIAVVCVINSTDELPGTGIPNWSLQPNPSDGAVTVNLPELQGSAVLDVVDMTGRAILSRTILPQTRGALYLDLGHDLARGTYLVTLSTEQGRSHKRLVLH